MGWIRPTQIENPPERVKRQFSGGRVAGPGDLHKAVYGGRRVVAPGNPMTNDR